MSAYETPAARKAGKREGIHGSYPSMAESIICTIFGLSLLTQLESLRANTRHLFPFAHRREKQIRYSLTRSCGTAEKAEGIHQMSPSRGSLYDSTGPDFDEDLPSQRRRSLSFNTNRSDFNKLDASVSRFLVLCWMLL